MSSDAYSARYLTLNIKVAAHVCSDVSPMTHKISQMQQQIAQRRVLCRKMRSFEAVGEYRLEPQGI